MLYQLAKGCFIVINYALTVFKRINRPVRSAGIVKGINKHHLSIKYIADLIPDEVIDCLHVQLGGQALLHAVDNGQLGGALLGLF